MLRYLLSKRSQDDTSPFTRDTLANSEIARISSMQKYHFRYTLPHKCVHVSKKTLWQYISLVTSSRTTMEQCKQSLVEKFRTKIKYSGYGLTSTIFKGDVFATG